MPRGKTQKKGLAASTVQKAMGAAKQTSQKRTAEQRMREEEEGINEEESDGDIRTSVIE